MPYCWGTALNYWPYSCLNSQIFEPSVADCCGERKPALHSIDFLYDGGKVRPMAVLGMEAKRTGSCIITSNRERCGL